MCATHFARRPQSVYEYIIRAHTCKIIKLRLPTKFEITYFLNRNIILRRQNLLNEFVVFYWFV